MQRNAVTESRSSVSAWLDKLVSWMPAIFRTPAHDSRHRRRIKWLPLLVIGLACGAFGSILIVPGQWEIGYVGLIACFFISVSFKLYGPIKEVVSPDDSLDERELSERHQALRVGYGCTVAVSLLGIWTLAAWAALLDIPRVVLIHAMLGLAFLILVFLQSIPTLYASWTTSELPEEA